MKTKARAVSLFLALLMIVGLLPMEVLASPIVPIGEIQALQVIYQAEDIIPQSFTVALSPETDGTWQWLTVPGDVRLRALEVRYLPDGEGTLAIALTPEEEAQRMPEDPYVLDFTVSASNPYAYTVYSNETGEVLWSGWLTISMAERPADLPAVPVDATEPPITVITPEPTEEVIVTAAPMPTEPPATLPPTEAPTEVIVTVAPTPTEPPATLPPTEAPTEVIVTVAPTPTEPPATLPPTRPPTRPPIITPRPTQTPTPRPQPQTGYAVITANNVNVRNAPQGTVTGRLQTGDVVYINAQAQGDDGMTWHYLTILDTMQYGYVRADLLRFMTQWEINEYLNRPTPSPSPRPTATPVLTTGYARVTWQSVSLRNSPSSGGLRLRTLTQGTVVYITGQSIDNYGTRWYAVRADGDYGYLLSTSVVMMTRQEITEYLSSLKPTPTPRPTSAPTLNPYFSYVVVKMNNVNFRETPGGRMIRRVHSGTLARLISGPVYADDYGWYRVEIEEDIGYLREDMIDFVQIAPSPTPRPTIRPTAVPTPRPTIRPTATPTPSPTPSLTPPLPTAQPLGIMDRVRAAADTVRYTNYARAAENAAAYAVRDFDSDKLMELLLASVARNADGTYSVLLVAYKLMDGEVKPVADYAFDGVLTSNTEMQLVLLEQNGRELIYFAERNAATGSSVRGRGLTLTDKGFVEMTLGDSAKSPRPMLLASADLGGNVTVEDHTGLRVEDEQAPKDTRDAVSAMVLVLIRIIESMSQGNG